MGGGGGDRFFGVCESGGGVLYDGGMWYVVYGCTVHVL